MSAINNADILVQNAYKNQILSPLLRLPDKVLVVLMKSFDLDIMLRLRHVSRIFMWLFSTDMAFEEYRLTPQQDEERYNDTARVWTPPSSSFKAQAAGYFGRMCSGCSLKRNGDILGKALLDDMPLLYCSRCRTKHTIIHFSERQRQLPETSDRVCIGHEGFFYLCDHLVPMTWHQLVSMEHNQVTPPEPDMMPATAACLYERHFDGEPLCDDETCAERFPPGLSIGRDEKEGLFMQIWTQQHISVKRLSSGKICVNSLRKALEQKPSGTELASWMPQLWPVAGNPLRAFDPNICDCVEWHGSSPDAKHVRWPMCPDPERPERPLADVDAYVSTESRCSLYDHKAFSRYTGAEGVIRFERCKGRDDLLVLFQTARYDIGDACGSGWEDIVYGASYKDTDDEDMRGVTWCPYSTCAVSTLLQRNRHLRSIETRQMRGSKWPREFLFH